MNIKFIHILWLAAFAAFSGCISEFHADIPFSDENILVVEGDIIANKDVNVILSKTFGLDENYLPGDYNNVQATVYLVGGNGYKSPAAEYMGDGIHRLSVDELQEDVLYHIEIEYDGQKYQSDPEKPLKTPEIDKLDWAQAYEKSNVSIRVSTHQDEPGFSYYMWDYVEDWEFTSEYLVNSLYNPELQIMEHVNWDPVYYCWRKRQGKEILIGSTESYTENKIINQQLRLYESQDERFDVLYSMRLKQISLTKRAYEYFQNRAKMSEDMGGLFTPQPSELVGNIKCITDPSRKVIGYINMLQNVSETQLYIKGSDVTKENVNKCSIISKEEIEKLKADLELEWHELYLMGYWPLEGDYLYTAQAWSFSYCIDCTQIGGSKNKPEWWPNDHK